MDRIKHPIPTLNARSCIFFLSAALLLYLRLIYQASYFPPFFEGEESLMLDLAKASCVFAAYTNSWWQAVVGSLPEYNKGYGWAMVPFYLHYGYDERIVTHVIPFFVSIFCAAFFTLYRKAYPKSSVFSILIAIVFGVFCVSVRRYKWHSFTYLTAVSVFLYFSPRFQAGFPAVRERWRKGLALALFALSCFFYFGGFVYAIPFFLLAVFFSDGATRRRELLAASLGLIVFLAAANIAYRVNDLWTVRICDSLMNAEKSVSLEGIKSRWWTTRHLFGSFSTPYIAIFLAGLAASFYRIKRGDRFALVNTTLLSFIWLFQWTIEGLNNPDQLNWSMIPILGVLLTGADVVLAAIRDNVRGGAAFAAALALMVAWNEFDFYPAVNERAYYQPFVQPRNTMTQGALVLMLIGDDTTGSAQYYLPDPSIPQSQGGFQLEVSMKRADFAKALAKVVFFTSEEDLRRKILAQRRDKWAIVYLSVDFKPDKKDAKDPAETPLLGQNPEIITPFEDVYHIQFLVRKFRMRPGGPVGSQAAGART